MAAAGIIAALILGSSHPQPPSILPPELGGRGGQCSTAKFNQTECQNFPPLPVLEDQVQQKQLTATTHVQTGGEQTENLALAPLAPQSWGESSFQLDDFSQSLADQCSRQQQRENCLSLQSKAIQDSSILQQAQTLNAQGKAYLDQGKPEQALESWQAATKLYTQLNDEQGRIGTLVNQAQVLQTLGYYRRSLTTLTQVNQALQTQPDSPLKISGLLSLGNAFLSLGVFKPPTETSETAGAKPILEQALTLAQSLEQPEFAAKAHLGLGNVQAQISDSSIDALQQYRQAGAIATTPLTQAQAQLNQLRLLTAQQRFEDAHQLWPQTQTLLGDMPPNHQSVLAQLHLAHSLLCLRQSQLSNAPCHAVMASQPAPSASIRIPALREIAKILAISRLQAKELNDLQSQATALGLLGQTFVQTQQWQTAQELTEQAINLAETANAPHIAYRQHWQLGQILNAKDPTQTDAAIGAYAQAINHLKTMRRNLATLNREAQFSFQTEVEPIYREYVGLLLQNPSQSNLAQARSAIEALQLAELDNYFRQACLDTQTVNVDEIDPAAAVIYPILLEDQLVVILSRPGEGGPQFHHHTIPVSSAEVNRQIALMRQKLVTRPTFEFLPAAQQLYAWILEPLQPALKDIDNLVFVLDGPLRSIPMAALHDGNQYLVERFNLALTPGLQLIQPQPLPQTKLRTVAGGLSQARLNFPALPYVQRELEQIEQLVPSRVLLDQTFTHERIRQTVQSTPSAVVHLATHGQFSSRAEDTYILTWDQRVNVNELHQLLERRELGQGAIELLVLSACQTAVGDPMAALGIAGVAVRSGARSTLATLWSVDDQATAMVMGQFYQNLAKRETKAGALREAQLQLLQDQKFRHPYYWAPYILLGNWL